MKGLVTSSMDLGSLSPVRPGEPPIYPTLQTPTLLPPPVPHPPTHNVFPELDHDICPIVEDDDAGWSNNGSEHGTNDHMGITEGGGGNHQGNRFNSYTPYLSSTPMRHGGKVNDIHAIEMFIGRSIRGEVTPGAQYKQLRRLYSKFK